MAFECQSRAAAALAAVAGFSAALAVCLWAFHPVTAAEVEVPRATGSSFLHGIERVGDEIWIATEDSAYRWRGAGPAVKVPGVAGEVTRICVALGCVWIATEQICEIEGGEARLEGRIFRWQEGTGAVTVLDDAIDLLKVGEEIWMVAHSGLYRWNSRSQPQHVPEVLGDCHSIQALGGAVWIGTSYGAYRVTRTGSIEEVLRGDTRLIRAVDDEVWITNPHGLFRWRPGSPPSSVSGAMRPRYILSIGSETWTGSFEGVFRWDSRGLLTREVTEPVEVMLGTDGEIWIGSFTGAYRAALGGPAVRVPGISGLVKSIHQFGVDIWLRSEEALYRCSPDGHISSIQHLQGRPLDLYHLGRTTSVATDEGAFRCFGDVAQKVRGTDAPIVAIQAVGEEVWLLTHGDGVMRWHEGSSALRRFELVH